MQEGKTGLQKEIRKVNEMPKLTKTFVDSLVAPATGDSWAWDSDVEGFGVRVQSSGRKTYVVRYRTKDGQRTQRKMTLCRCSDVAPEKARELARKVFGQVAEGKDPVADRKPKKDSQSTVENMFKGYIAHMVEKCRASAPEVERVLLHAKYNAADSLGRAREASEVTPLEVVEFVSKFYLRGHRGAADKARSYIASAYNWAITSANDYTVKNRQDWGINRNPAADVAKDQGATNARDRNLSAVEIKSLWEASFSEGFSFEVGACVRLLISCGQRVQETLRIEGVDIDLEAKVWKMPAHKTKGRKHSHSIPLPAVIIPTIRKLIEKHGSGHLFPSRTGSQEATIHHRSINQSIKRWNEANEAAEAFQTRDLRRTWKSRTHDAGIERFMRDLIQQHAKNDTGSKNYDRADYLPEMTAAMTKWSAWLGVVLSGATPPKSGQMLVKSVA